ncbi:MAG: hypothetical protein NC311_02605 [Muribaculaceae bacterium]|nr:hypothetical protein [Muribaculaceae bacterium]
MTENLIKFLRAAFPFLLTIALWRLSSPFWNPGGILALIPVWYYVFVRRVPWFGLFGLIVCFLIDYKFNTIFLWTSIYCLFYAANGFQSVVDMTQMERDAVAAFMVFIGFGILIAVGTAFSFTNILRGVWMFLFASALYIPIIQLTKRVRHD